MSIKAKCECGKTVDILHCDMDTWGDISIEIEACTDCKEKARSEGYEEAKAEGE